MIASEFLRSLQTLPVTRLEAVVGGGGLLVVAPHPDDESLGCGGIIATASALGIAVRVIVLSDGTGSHPGSVSYPPERLRALRESETRAALDTLGCRADAVRFLRLPDRFVPTDGPDAAAAQEAIYGAAAEIAAGALCVTWGGDPHCDHAAAAALVDALVGRLGSTRVYSYVVWGWTLPPETEVGPAPAGIRVDIEPHLLAKARAIAAHRSQTSNLIQDDPDGFRLTSEMLVHFGGPFEFLIAAEPRVP